MLTKLATSLALLGTADAMFTAAGSGPGGGDAYHVSAMTHKPGFRVDTVTMTPPSHAVTAWAPGVAATVTVSGEATAAVTAGTVKWQLYQDGVSSFIESGNSNYYDCDNKGCDPTDPIALKWLQGTSGKYVLHFQVALPPSKIPGDPGHAPSFRLVFWGEDQHHEPYDFSATVSFGYPAAPVPPPTATKKLRGFAAAAAAPAAAGTSEHSNAAAQAAFYQQAIAGRTTYDNAKAQAAFYRNAVGAADSALVVACKNPDHCLELTMPKGAASPYWAANSYKYVGPAHPECSLSPCDRSAYPVRQSEVDNVQGYQGVTLVKWGSPAAAVQEAAAAATPAANDDSSSLYLITNPTSPMGKQHCQELDNPGGTSSKYWAAKGWKYTSPPWKPGKCDRNRFNFVNRETQNLDGFEGVTFWYLGIQV